MEFWQWALVVLAGLSALFVMGSIVWGVFDVIGEDRLDQMTRALWVLAFFVLPLFGIVAWLFAKSKVGGSNGQPNLKNTL